MTIDRARYDEISRNECMEKGVFSWESQEHHVRRLLDPLEVAFADTGLRQKILGMAAEGLSTSVRRGNTTEAIEFAADFAYRAFGVAGSREVTAATNTAHKKASELLEQDSELTPAEQLALRGRQFDMISLREFSRYLDGKEGRTAVEEVEAFDALMKVNEGILKRSGGLLMDAVATYSSLDDYRQREKLGGRIFELLYTSFLRLELFANEEVGDRVVVGATSFEDNSAKKFRPHAHNYDVLVMDAQGQTVELIQCKAAYSEITYQPPIQKVTGNNFTSFIENPGEYVAAMLRLVANDPDVSADRLARDQELLESLFDESKRTGPRQLGAYAVSEAYSS